MVILVSHPYTATTHDETYLNVCRAMEIGKALLDKGHTPIIPHLFHFWNDHLLATGGVTYGYEVWMRITLAYVALADAVYCERESPGVLREVCHGEELEKVIYTELDQVPYAWTNETLLGAVPDEQ